MSLILQSSGGGQITVQEPATASNFTQTLPAATGTVMVSGNQPAFSAYTTTTQAISQSTWTKVNFPSEDFDTANNFASNRFTPTVAGYYQLNTSINFGGASNANVMLYRNGNAYRSLFSITTSASSYSMGGSCLAYANGTTDYYEVYVFTTTAGVSLYGDGSGNYGWFNGSLVRAA
jgi:hypothetical protein